MDDDIIRMAREAGLSHFYDSEGDFSGVTDALLVDADKQRNDERLVEILGPLIALVRADERERIKAEPRNQCRSDGRCQYAIDHGAEGMGHCPKGKCVMAQHTQPAEDRAVAQSNLRVMKEMFREQAEPVQEPVAWRTFDGEGGYDYRTYEDNDSYAAEWTQRNPRHIGWVEPLYTAPPKPEPVDTDCHAQGICQRSGYGIGKQAEPLTEKEMYVVEEEARKNFRLSQAGPRGQMITYWDSLTPWLIRAVERAHGIGNKK